MSSTRRSRSRSMLGFGGKRSSLLFGKGDIEESHQEKEAHKVHTKADPTKAVSEPQPAAWSLEQSTISSLRSMEHKDSDGNPITDPDASNPTRPRMERPLDTIRSFEAAIDHSYSRRPMSRADSRSGLGPHLRHNSYNPGPTYAQRSPVDGAGYNGQRMYSRPSSFVENTSPHHYGQNRRFGQSHRVASDPTLYGQNAQSVYPSHGYQQSYDTVGSASVNGSGATDPWGNSTDPSSENSSIDKFQQAAKPDLGEQYGFSGFGGAPQYQGPILEEHGQDSPGYGQPGYGQSHTAPGGGFPFQGNDVPHLPLHTIDSSDRTDHGRQSSLAFLHHRSRVPLHRAAVKSGKVGSREGSARLIDAMLRVVRAFPGMETSVTRFDGGSLEFMSW